MWTLIGFCTIGIIACQSFKALWILLHGPYKTAKYPDRSVNDAVSAWKKRTYYSPKEAEWALDSAMEWAKDFTAPTKRDAYKALDARLDYYLK